MTTQPAPIRRRQFLAAAPGLSPYQLAEQIGKSWTPPGLTADAVKSVNTTKEGSLINIAVKVNVPGMSESLGALILSTAMSPNLLEDVASATKYAHRKLDEEFRSSVDRKKDAVPSPEQLALDQLPAELEGPICKLLGIDPGPQSRKYFL